MSSEKCGEAARLIPNRGHFIALCSEGHKIALVWHRWTVEIMCRCKHAVRIGPEQTGRLGFAFCPNRHKVAEVMKDGTIGILCRCRRLMLIRDPGGHEQGVSKPGGDSPTT